MKRYTQRSAGFTLIELLVVITIIGMLMALLLPAVNAAVEMARAAACKNNIRNLAIAANAFESGKGRYPGYREYVPYSGNQPFNYGPPDGKAATGQGFSWLVPLLPQLDQNSWYNEFTTPDKDGNLRTRGRYSELFVCPSDPPTSTSEGSNSYIINAGYYYGTDTSTASANEISANGIAHDYAVNSNSPNTGPSTSAEYVSSGDGATYTMLITENVQDSDWYWGGNELTPAGRVPAVFVWHKEGGATGNRDNPIRQINGRGNNADASLLDVPASIDACRPSSFHTGQVHASFCDARTIVLSEGIDYLVYQQLMTPRWQECVIQRISDNDGIKNHVLSDNDYR